MDVSGRMILAFSSKAMMLFFFSNTAKSCSARSATESVSKSASFVSWIMVFMILFEKTEYTNGLMNLILGVFGVSPIDFIDGPYWAKMFVLCFYTVWVVLPFKILILTSALASVNQDYYKAAKVDGTSKWRIFRKITLPMISPTLFYLIITGFIGAFKAYSDAVALFGTDLNTAGMNTIVGYVYDILYGNSGGYPSYASAAAIILFAIVLSITCINLLVSKKHVHY